MKKWQAPVLIKLALEKTEKKNNGKGHAYAYGRNKS
jgi:hypothetical protein